MSTDLVFIVLLLLIVVFVAGLMLLILLFTNRPEVRKRRALNRQAVSDYKSSRGTAHLKLLIEACKHLQHNITQNEQSLKNQRIELKQLEIERQNDMITEVEKQILAQHIHEIPGIGPKFRDQLRISVFRSRLADLHYASNRISGIGESRQHQINVWVRSWEQKVTDLIKEQFSGKNVIEEKYRKLISEKERGVDQLETKDRALTANFEKAKILIAELKLVTIADFKYALENPGRNRERLEAYLRGVFPEWEPMPAWFKEIILEN